MYNPMGHRPDVWAKDWHQTMLTNSIKWGMAQMK